MRFDMRAADGPTSAAPLYAAALDMAAWAEERGCVAVQVSEHHGSPDGYLPCPIPMATALAARTRRVPIQVAALQLPLHDPVELAEQMAVADLLSGGRISYVCVVGYREEEYAMFGRPMRGRGRRLEEIVAFLRRAWRGETVEFEGRRLRVTPLPATPGGPVLWMGGGSPVVARRAARLGMGMLTQGGTPGLEAAYLEACREHGTPPGLFFDPPPDLPLSCFVAEDPDRAWADWGPYLLHDARTYAEWLGSGSAAVKSRATSVAELRAEAGSYRIYRPEEAVEHIRRHGLLALQPLAGGLPPDRAWQSLELLERAVLPAL